MSALILFEKTLWSKRALLVCASIATLGLSACSDQSSEKKDESSQHIEQATVEYKGAEFWPLIENPVKTDDATEAKIAELVAKMSVEEKVGQIIQGEIQYLTPQDVIDYHLGSVLNGGGSLPNRNKYATPGEWLAMADSFYDASMDTTDGKQAIPIIWGSDAVHGHNNVIGATIFPHNIGLGAMHNPDLMEQVGRVTAREMRVTGIDWTFAPTLAVVQNDRWGRTYESYSEDPAVVRSYGGRVVLGLQGKPGTDEFLDVNHVVASAKHFVADGGTEGGDDQGDAKVSEKELRDIHAAGYYSAMEAGAQTAMASFSSWNGEKLSGHKYLLTDVLKGRMGLQDGLLVGDWNAHGQVPGCTNASCAAAVNAGIDLMMVPQDWKAFYENTLAQVKAGEITMERLEDAVSRILRVKIRAGLFEKGRPSDRGIAGKGGIIGSAEHRAVARQAVRESLVLMKNENAILPLDPRQKILVAGDGADNIGKQTGGWTISWQGTGNSNEDFPGGTSIFDGLKAAIEEGGGSISYAEDGSYTEKPDVAVVVFGEHPYAEFQGDLDSLEYEAGNKLSLAMLQSFKEENIPVVSVFISGRPLWTNPEINASDAFVAVWLPGTEGIGVADVLVADSKGKPQHDFKGSLSFSWPKTPLQDVLNPHHENYDPQFSLGYGLTYASGQEGPENLPENVEGVMKGGGDSIALYAGRPMSPWRIYLDDEQSIPLVMSGAYGKLSSGTVEARTEDKDVQEDAMTITFSGEDSGSLAISGGEPMDLSEFLAEDGVIAFDIKIDAVPATDLDFAIACGEGCERKVKLNDHLKALAGHGWQRISVGLACLAQEQDDFTAITQPFRIDSKGKAELSFANVAISKVGPPSYRCRK